MKRREWTASEMARESNKKLTDRQRSARRENARKATAARIAKNNLAKSLHTSQI